MVQKVMNRICYIKDDFGSFFCAFRRAYLSNVEFAGNLQRRGQSIAELKYRMLKEFISADQSPCKTITDENNKLILTPHTEFPLN